MDGRARPTRHRVRVRDRRDRAALLLTFEMQEFISGVPRADNTEEQQFRTAIADVFRRVRGRDGNLGSTPEHRALNFLALRYPSIYAVVEEGYTHEASLTGIET